MNKLPAYQSQPCTEQDIQAVRDVLPAMAKEFSCQQVISAVCVSRGCADCWDVLNALDHLVMASEIVELTAGTECMGQHRRYVR